MSKLTAKQEMFCREYLIDLNGTQAAIRAGYSKRTARQAATENLAKPAVAARLKDLMAAREERTQVTSDDVLKILYEDATADLAELFDDGGQIKPIHEWPLVFRRGLVAGIDNEEIFGGSGKERVSIGNLVKVKLADRTRIKELLGKHQGVGAFIEKHDHTSSDGSMTPTAIERVIVYPEGD